MSNVYKNSQKHEARKYVGISWNSNLKLACEINCDLPRIVCIFVQKIYIALFKSVLIGFELPILFVTLNTSGPES